MGSSLAEIGGILANDFPRMIVLRATAKVKPNGTTPVNDDTGFFAEAGQYVLDPVRALYGPCTDPVRTLGHRVVVTAIPKQYDWCFGDGQSALDGTYTVEGGAARNVIGTAQTPGRARRCR